MLSRLRISSRPMFSTIVTYLMAEKSSPLKLEPGRDGDYYLYWDWNGNDTTATIIAEQYNEQIGKIAVPTAVKFNANNGGLNFSADVMAGKPVPAGTITITIRDERGDVYIDRVDVQGRRDVVNYKVSTSQLDIRADRKIIEKVVLRTTDTDGRTTYYPLYAADNEKPYLFEGMTISDGKIVEDPTVPTGHIIAIQH